MSETTIRVRRAGPILTLTFNRPEKRNALNSELVDELTTMLNDARSDSSVRVIILTGEGKAFCAGADLDSLHAMQSASRAQNEADSEQLAVLFRAIYTHPRVVVARVNGHAIAGGCGIVAAADFAIAADTVKLGFTEVKIGFVPSIVSTILLRKLRGADVRRLLLTGDLVTAEDAVEMGLLSAAVPSADLDDAVDDLAARISTETSPVAIALTKELLTQVPDLTLGSALEYATEVNVAARLTDDCRAGVQAFLEKKPAPWALDGAGASE